MKKIIFSLLLAGLSLTAFAQQRSTLRGRVVDLATGQPLFGASVVVDSLKNGMAGEDGAFTVANVARGEALVEIFSMGYKTVTRKVDFNRNTVDLGTVGLSVDEALQIDAVVVTGAANPVIQHGDTTQFNAAAFKTNPDAEAADLVAKIPGMEVSESGVTAQGEAVARVYVNGEIFFGDDAMSALGNIPADMVESVEMFDEQPDEARFSGFNDGVTQRALNIVTRDPLRRTIDLRLSAGWGRELQRDVDGNYQPRYNVGGRLNVFTDKTAFNLNGIVNNAGQTSFGGGGRGRGAFGGGAGLRTISRFGTNYTTDLSETSTLNLSYDYGGNKNRNNSLTISNYYPTDKFDSRLTRDTLSSRSSGAEHQFFTRYDLENDRDRVRVQFRVEAESDDSDRFRISEEWRDGADFTRSVDNDYSDGNGWNVDGMVDWSHKLGEKAGRTFGVQATFDYGEDGSDGVEDSDLTKFYEGETDPTNIYWVTNHDHLTRDFRLSVNYNEPISERLRLNVNYRPSYHYSSNETIRADRFGDLDSLVSERFTYDYMMHTGRVGLAFNKEGHFNFSVSLNAQSASRAQSMVLPRDYDMERSFTTFMPSASFRYYVNRERYFHVNYSTGSQLPSLEQLTSVLDVTDPMRYTAGNSELEPTYSHRLNIRYNSNNIAKATNFYASLNGSVTTKSIDRQTLYFDGDTVLPEYGDFVFTDGTTLSRYQNVGTASSLNAGTGYGFVIRPLKLNVNAGANYGYTHRPSYVGETLTTINTNNAMLILSANSNISENVDFTVGAFLNYSTTDKVDAKFKETWGRNVFTMVNYIFGGGFVLNANYRFNTNTTLTEPSNVLSAYIGRKFLRNNAAEFRIEFNDILNQSRNYSYSYGTEAEIESWNRVMGRYIMGRLTYRFNSLRNGGARGPRGASSGQGDYQVVPGGGRPAGPPQGGGHNH